MVVFTKTIKGHVQRNVDVHMFRLHRLHSTACYPSVHIATSNYTLYFFFLSFSFSLYNFSTSLFESKKVERSFTWCRSNDDGWFGSLVYLQQ
jgi:hypothetical protein